MGNSKSVPDKDSSVVTGNNENLSLKGSSSNLDGVKGSGSVTALNKPTINAPPEKQRKAKGAGSARSSMSSEGRGKPVLPLSHRQIIKTCIDNSKEDLGDRIIRRVVEKRDDFRTFWDCLTRAQRNEITEGLRKLLFKILESLTDNDEVQRISEEFGERFVLFRSSGFKPDYFASTADAMTTECIYLDAAVHSSTETMTAWSVLTAAMFSAVRDGYYAEMRRLRRASNCNTSKSKESVDLSSDGSAKADEDQTSHRSASPAPDSDQTVAKNESFSSLKNAEQIIPTESSNNFLSPPQVF